MSRLPVEDVVPEVRAALAGPGGAVLVAPPGSGKTTLVPLQLRDEPWLDGGRILVLEPRRLATRAAARWMARLCGEEIGDSVGYVTRDDRRTGPATRVEVVTEGVLTRRLQRDPTLPGTGLVIFDELHERNLQTDLGLALTLDVKRQIRPDLRILAMSATIDAAGVAALIGGQAGPVPVIRGEARVHPVDVRWVPPGRRARFEDHVAAVVRRALAEEPGDVLVFLPGMGEILRVAERLGPDDPTTDLRRLHGSLPLEEQDAAIAPSPPGRRKVVLATDIAESSLTVEGIRVVVDGGRARAPRFDPRTGMTRLRTVEISRASADQRAGRAGRIEPGVAYRLWSRLEHGGRPPHITAEIAEVDLAGLALELAAWGDADLDFLDPPPARALGEATRLLTALGALDDGGGITAVGREMVGLPLHPRLAHMVVAADPEDRYLACLLAALIDERDIIRGRPDEVPVDLAFRVRVATGAARHPGAGRRTLARLERRTADLARRAGVAAGPVAPERTGRVVALAFPDRLAVRRGSPGRFQLRTGTTAWVPVADPLAPERFLVPADLDGRRKDARIRLAAAIEAAEVADRFAAEVTTTAALTWVDDRLVHRTERKLGGLRLDVRDRRPDPAPEVTAEIVARLRRADLAVLPWTEPARALLRRVAFLHERFGPPWPDWSDPAAAIDEWLVPHLDRPTGLDDLSGLDLVAILRRTLGRLVADLDRLAPTHLELPGGRRRSLDYSGDVPVLAVPVQELFGVTATPEVAGEPVLVHLLSPAGRPVQITRDLAGFWSGSWHEVRREMAGRYPKHDWPEEPGPGR